MSEVSDAIFTVLATTLILIVLYTALSPVIDNFIYEFMKVIDLNDIIFQSALSTTLHFATVFYFIPTLSVILLTVWMFKVTVWKHRYERYDEEEEYQY